MNDQNPKRHIYTNKKKTTNKTVNKNVEIKMRLIFFCTKLSCFSLSFSVSCFIECQPKRIPIAITIVHNIFSPVTSLIKKATKPRASKVSKIVANVLAVDLLLAGTNIANMSISADPVINPVEITIGVSMLSSPTRKFVIPSINFPIGSDRIQNQKIFQIE